MDLSYVASDFAALRPNGTTLHGPIIALLRSSGNEGFMFWLKSVTEQVKKLLEAVVEQF